MSTVHLSNTVHRKSLPSLSSLPTSCSGDKSLIVSPNNDVFHLPKVDLNDVSQNLIPTMTSKKNSNGHIDFFYPSVSKSKNEQFHKLFQTVPDDEFPIDYFSCAFKGDILLQGLMYVSPNWICFYSKIKGRGRRMEIPFNDVICITREKTALVFPNAIGIQTADNKIVFGSFMSRDSTYRLLENLWKTSQDIERDSRLISSSDYRKSDKCSSLSESSSFEEDTCTGISDTDIDVCLVCGDINIDDTISMDDTDRKCLMCKSNNNLDQKSSKMDRLPFLYIIKYFDCHKPINAFCRLKVCLQHIPRTSLLLAVCTILVFFLLVSAAGLTYKIILIQAKIDLGESWTPHSKHNFRDHMMNEAFYVQREAHESTIKHLHSVIKANIHLLQEVHDSLKSLLPVFVKNTCNAKECP